MLTQADLGRLNALAQAKKISKSEVLRQAAFQPVQR
ncbi:MAG TPA: ribbon-helix-helix protein, CopG family [Opitutaceae bacterium]|nr:ribbon-helix-helix protein, CopG family [Opitutaceae bacterium]HOR25212.1 ribbon-helix-helix protein, CopG family [Opitutaceae bacterium]HPK49863.1 ribbon-helix-helix protein, CopG family [Opitutaceae bacterium]